jgi:hypothetical protein
MDALELLLAERFGDFEVDVLCRWTSRGPPHQVDIDAGLRAREITGQCAVLIGAPGIADVRRQALEHSFGMLVVSAEVAEIERDPFAVAYRVSERIAHPCPRRDLRRRPRRPPTRLSTTADAREVRRDAHLGELALASGRRSDTRDARPVSGLRDVAAPAAAGR